MTYLKSDNLLMDDLKATDPIKADFYFFDQHYGGYRPFELAINIVDTNENSRTDPNPSLMGCNPIICFR